LAGAVSLFGTRQDTRIPVDDEVHAAGLAAARAALGDEAFDRLWAEGKAMTLEEAVAYALAEGDG
jgi:hypothetical protein